MSEFSNDPNQSGYIQTYPDRQAEVDRLRASRNPEPEDKILDREQAAEFLNISLSTLDRHVRDGKVPYIRLSGRILFRKFSLDRFIQEKEFIPDSFESHFSPEQLATVREQTEAMERSARIIDLSKIIRQAAQLQMDKKRWDVMPQEEKDQIYEMLRIAGEEHQALCMEEEALKQKQLERLRDKLGIKG